MMPDDISDLLLDQKLKLDTKISSTSGSATGA